MKIAFSAISTCIALGIAAPATAGTITPDIIFGSGNSNRGFEVTTADTLELGLRAKQRYTSANDQIGVGIVRDAQGNYLFDTTGQTIPANRSVFNFDWSINSDIADGSTRLDAYDYAISVDTDPTAAVSFVNYDPLSALSTGYYLGTNASGNGGTPFDSGGDEDFSLFNVAQNSVNFGFLGAPVGAGIFDISLSAFKEKTVIASTSIRVYVDQTPTPVPLPAGLLLTLTGLGAFGLMRGKRR